MEEAPFGCQRVHSGADILHLKRFVKAMFCTLRGTVGVVLRMSEDVVVDETTSFAKIRGSPPHTTVLP